jgi:hypothetical protein
VGKIGVFVHHRRGDEAIHAFFPQQLYSAFLGGVAALTADDEQHVTLRLGECAHAGRDFVIVRIIVFLDDERDAAVPAGGAHSRLLRWSIVEKVDRGKHAVSRVAPDTSTVIEDSRDGGLGDSRLTCDV